MNRQKLALFLLLLVLAGSLAYSFLGSPRQERVATLKFAPGAPAPAQQRSAPPRKSTAPPGRAAGAKGEGDEARVHLELLEQETPRTVGFRRNIFTPIFREELKPPPFKPLLLLPPPPRPVRALLSAPPPQPEAAPAPPSVEQIADSELAKFTFLGFLEKNGEKTVFLSGNNEIFLARKGTNLGPKFQVTGLTDDAITIRSVAGGREVVIPLVENRVLGTRRSRP